MTNSVSREWHLARRAEDCLFLLGDLDDRRKTIRVQAWHEGDWATVYKEATEMKATVATMRKELAELFEALAKEAMEAQ